MVLLPRDLGGEGVGLGERGQHAVLAALLRGLQPGHFAVDGRGVVDVAALVHEAVAVTNKHRFTHFPGDDVLHRCTASPCPVHPS
jgi:hypothetical protein